MSWKSMTVDIWQRVKSCFVKNPFTSIFTTRSGPRQYYPSTWAVFEWEARACWQHFWHPMQTPSHAGKSFCRNHCLVPMTLQCLTPFPCVRLRHPTPSTGILRDMSRELGTIMWWPQRSNRTDWLSTCTTPVEKARIKAVAIPQTVDWLNAPPIIAFGVCLSDEAIRMSVGLRLQSTICNPHTCI